MYNSFRNRIIIGEELISPHLLWVLEHAIDIACPDSKGVHSLIFKESVPANKFGHYYQVPGCIVINLYMHLSSAEENIYQNKHMHYSIPYTILSNIIDTAAHEALHAKDCLLNGNQIFDDSQEIDITKEAKKILLSIGNKLDINVKDLGPYLNEGVQEAKEYITEQLDEENPPTCIKLQNYMLQNNIAYYAPENREEIATTRDLLSAVANTPYLKSDHEDFIKFVPINQAQEETVQEEYDDREPEMKDETHDITKNLSPPPPPPTLNKTVPPPPNRAAPPPPNKTCQTSTELTVDKIEEVMELVLTRMFITVFTKCGWNKKGGFNSAESVIAEINISDIRGHEIFHEQECLNEMAVPTKEAVNGKIKGILIGGLPSYNFYINNGGIISQHTFSAISNKTMRDGKPSPWAEKTINGCKLMKLLKPGSYKPLAHMELPPGEQFGSEKYTVWADK